jgi:chorismate dehydratase
MAELRIGAVSYLNTIPLIAGLDEVADDTTMSGHIGKRLSLALDLPGRLADQLESGELDVALIPSIELFRNPDYTVVSDACIACCGPVWSVKLLSRCPIGRIRSMALDEGSRTSAAMVQMLMEQEHGIVPATFPLPIGEDWESSSADAVLVIGDRAMKAQSATFRHQIDLGQWWLDRTGLPFVFAMWCARPGLATEDLDWLDAKLCQSRDFGESHSEQLAIRHAPDYGLSVSECLDYFQKYLHFRLGAEERAGLIRFHELSAASGLVLATRELQFHAC